VDQGREAADSSHGSKDDEDQYSGVGTDGISQQETIGDGGGGGTSMSSRGERGLGHETLELIDAAKKILESQWPMTVRGICYQLFGQKLIPDMSRRHTARVSRALVSARERGLISWGRIVDESREIERVAQWDDIEQFTGTVVPTVATIGRTRHIRFS